MGVRSSENKKFDLEIEIKPVGGGQGGGTMKTPNGALINANSVRFVTINNINDLNYTNINVTAANISSLIIVDEYIVTDQTLTYKGLIHNSLGAATLEVINADTLSVNQIGASGLDGFSVDVADYPYLALWGIDTEMDFDQMAEGSSINVTSMGTVSGIDNQVISIANYEKAGDTLKAFADFSSVGATSVIGYYLYDSVIVGMELISLSSFNYYIIPGGITSKGNWKWTFEISRDSTKIDLIITIERKDPQPATSVITPNGNTIIANSVRFVTVNNIEDVLYANVNVTAAKISSLIIVDEYIVTDQTLTYKGLIHNSLGVATLEVINADTLSVNQIGASGLDGFSVDISQITDAIEWGIETAIESIQLPEGASFSIASKGIVSGIENQVISSSNYLMVNDTIVASYDFSPTGTDSVTAYFYLENILVYQAVIPTSTFQILLASIDKKPHPWWQSVKKWFKEDVWPDLKPIVTEITIIILKSAANWVFDQIGGGKIIIMADRIELHTDVDISKNVSISNFEVTAANHTPFYIVDEYVISTQTVGADLTVLLEGPYNGSTMSATLNSQGFIPLNQPFNVAPWNYMGMEMVSSIPNPDIVDWVLIELRDASSAAEATSATRIARQAAFIRSDGKITDLLGNLKPNFGSLNISNNLYVVVYHRNHLSILSANGLTQTNDVYTYDFSTGSGQAYGGALAQKEIAPGVWGMIGGDGDADATIGTSDKDPVWVSEAGTRGYIASDYNLDVQSNNQDKNDIWKPNLGAESQVPVGQTFPCGSLLLDARDGQSYQTVSIGDQCWMAENLNIGTMVNGSTNQTDNSTIEKYCYSNNTTNCDVYGGLYQWDEAMQYTLTPGVPGICPTGWHLPTDEEWCTLEQFIEPTIPCDRTWFSGTHAGGDLKETGTIHWYSPNTGATDAFGFTALPGGKRDNGSFDSFPYFAFFWTSNEYDINWGWCRALYYDYASIRRAGDSKTRGYSVRCLKD
jgi:uncharacterized protein (TIGR02145 family)